MTIIYVTNELSESYDQLKVEYLISIIIYMTIIYVIDELSESMTN